MEVRIGLAAGVAPDGGGRHAVGQELVAHALQRVAPAPGLVLHLHQHERRHGKAALGQARLDLAVAAPGDGQGGLLRLERPEVGVGDPDDAELQPALVQPGRYDLLARDDHAVLHRHAGSPLEVEQPFVIGGCGGEEGEVGAEYVEVEAGGRLGARAEVQVRLVDRHPDPHAALAQVL